jgi:hypothetical protein
MAYPVYVTLSSIAPEVQCDPSEDAHVLLALIPVAKTKKQLGRLAAKIAGQRFVHDCLSEVFHELKEAAANGMELTSGNGEVRVGFPILAISCLDFPEQSLHACTRGCPKCKVDQKQYGDNVLGDRRDPADTLRLIQRAARTCKSLSAIDAYLKEHGLNFILEPFWKNWAHVDIHSSMAPDILHQVYQGLIKHVTLWCRQLIGDDEMDARMAALPKCFGLRHFDEGISILQSVSGTEHRAISRQLEVIMAAVGVNSHVKSALFFLIDFTFMVQSKIHSDETIDDIQETLNRFHEHKAIFIKLGACASTFNPIGSRRSTDIARLASTKNALAAALC